MGFQEEYKQKLVSAVEAVNVVVVLVVVPVNDSCQRIEFTSAL